MTSLGLRGTYYEACNCESICPCRMIDGADGGRATYGVCDFALSWRIAEGTIDGVDVRDRHVAVAGHYSDDEPGKPWRVVLYIDGRCTDDQRDALVDTWLHRLDFSPAIKEVLAIRDAVIELDHTPAAQRIEVTPWVSVRTRENVDHDVPVSCGIPGHDHPGSEIVADHLRVDDGDLSWGYRGRTGFATDFAYRS
jgi:hypothetical protein